MKTDLADRETSPFTHDRARNPETETETSVLQAVVRVSQHLDFEAQLQALTHHASSFLGADCGFGLAPVEERGKLGVFATTVPTDDPRHIAFGHLDAGRVAEAVGGAPAVHEGLGALGQLLGRWPDPRPANSVTLPLLDSAGQWRGAVACMLSGPPGSDALSRVGRVFDLSRPAVSNAMQVLAMRELVIKDDTAHCFNRRYFEEFLPEELSRASRFRSPLSLIFLDMDNLKQVNNRHGHAVGSRTLTEVSGRIRRKIRKFDKLFRFGGDEFCIVLPETEWHGAMEVAERVRDAIAGRAFLIGELGAANAISMTASLGVAAYPLHARTQQQLIRQADRAMQEVKGTTKNSISVAEFFEGEDEP
jgi:diguanylate cyclase (GGDEF)-like protein